MLKRLGFAGAVLLAAAAVWAIFFRSPVEERPAVPSMEDLRGAPAGTREDDAVNLALKAITLSQGENGIEVWRLKASWAGMTQADGRINVEKPRLVYFMPPDNQELHVDADTGDIDQKNHMLRFVGNVSATLEDRVVTGPLLVYDGRARTMTFSRGAAFQNSGMNGSANSVVWLLGSRTITAEGDLQVEFQSPAAAPGPAKEE